MKPKPLEWRIAPPEPGFPENLLEIGWRLQQRRKVNGKYKYVTLMIGHKLILKQTAEQQNSPMQTQLGVTIPRLDNK